MRGKYKRLTDLYVQGTAVELADGGVLWMQVLNPYERDEALHDAQVARSRMVMALKEHGEESLKVEARMLERGREAIIEEIAGTRASNKLGQYLDDVRSDPEWAERIQIMDRDDANNSAAPLAIEEVALLAKIQTDYLAEITRRQGDEHSYQVRSLERLSHEELHEAYLDLWLEQRGNAIATGEYLLTEMWFGARVCNGVKDADGVWDHSECHSHEERVFEDKNEARSIPEALQRLLRDAIESLTMSPRDAKNSDRQESSSDSSPLPSEPVESTPSIPTETPESAPGISQPQLATV